MTGPGEITRLLNAHRDGDRGALDALVALVYDDLRALAGAQVRRLRGRETLGVTGVVHEAYLRLAESAKTEWESRGHFFAVCARAMRQIVISYARHHAAAKRGSGRAVLSLDEQILPVEEDATTLIAIGEALGGLAAIDQRLADVVECRFFAGLSEAETAEALGVSLRTVQRDWLRARAWLKEALSGQPDE
jgi:RNA polymerase sigma factor (TIGR02999 family)